MQEQRQQMPPKSERPADKKKQEVMEPNAPNTGIKIAVKGFRFTGNYKDFATEVELQRVVAENIGKEVDFNQLQQIAARITQYLRSKRGFLLTRAYLPKQEIVDGIVEICVISGHIDGKVSLDVSESARISRALVSGISARAIREDRPVRMEDLERVVLLIGDLPGIKANASLAPGITKGSTSVTLHATEGPLFRGTLSGDDYGDRYTGSYRTTGQFCLIDPFSHGDQWNISYTYAAHLNQWQIGYILPLGTAGLVWNTSYNGLAYELGKELRVLREKGNAHTLSSEVTYPLIRTRNKSIWAGVGMEYMAIEDMMSGVKMSDRKLTNGTASLSGSFYDALNGGGFTSASIVFTGGSVNLTGNAINEDSDSLGPRTQGAFTRLSYFLARLQRLAPRTALFASLRGQFATDNLDSSQKFILGGPTGVRAYPVGEAPGDAGHAFTLESRYDVPSTPRWAETQLIGFFDTGLVKLHNSVWPGSVINASGRNDYSLSGIGAGINVGKSGLYSIKASYTHTIGRNEGRTIWGNNSDNRNEHDRLWLQLLIWF